jgi:non-homologous end joining protein Ku
MVTAISVAQVTTLSRTRFQTYDNKSEEETKDLVAALKASLQKSNKAKK